MAPSHSKAVQITLPEAEILADLYGIEYDLDTSIELCLKVYNLSKDKLVDYKIVEAVTTAALIRFFRCISTGVRLGIPPSDIEELSEKDQGIYQYLKDLRNKHVAHSVNAFENSYVTATATVQDGEMLPITSLGPGHHRVVLCLKTAQQLVGVARKLRAINEAKIAKEKENLLTIVQACPLAEIHGGNLYTPEPLLKSHVAKARRSKTRSNTYQAPGGQG